MQLLSLLKELSLHPKNADELKGLVLQLAVQGKLTAKWREDNPNIELASELLKRIEAEKQQLIKEKKLKKEKPLPAIGDHETPYELPESWDWTKLGIVSLIVGGGTPQSSNPEYFCENGIPWFTPADLGKSKDKYVERGRRDITQLGLDKSSAQLMPAGSVLFSSRAPIGHTAIGIIDFATNQGFKSSVPYIKNMNEFIYIYLNSIVKEANDNASGTTFKEVSGAVVKNFLFPLPPLEEQKAIVEVVNQLFAKIEQLEEFTKECISLKEDFVASALRNLTTSDNTNTEWDFLKEQFSTFFTETAAVKKLRETILQLAVQGKLTAKWRSSNPNIEPASELLKRIKAEKQQLIKEKKIKKENPLPAISDDEKPFELPEGWVWCRMLEICKLITDGAHHTPTYTDSGVPFLSVKDMSSGFLNFDNTRFVSEDTHKDLIKRCYPEEKDVLLTKVGTTGIAISIDTEKEFSIFVSVALLKIFSNEIYSKYLEQCINSPVIKKQSDEGTEGVGNKNLVLRKIKAFTVPLPPLEEQQAIVEKVNSLIALCDALEQQIETSHSQVEQLMQSCLKEVFGIS